MSNFIKITNTTKLQQEGISLQDVGKATGLLGLGRKIYLVFDKNEGWGVKSLNIFERAARFFFGAFEETHKAVVTKQLKSIKIQDMKMGSVYERVNPAQACFITLIAKISKLFTISPSEFVQELPEDQDPRLFVENEREVHLQKEGAPTIEDTPQLNLQTMINKYRDMTQPDIQKNMEVICQFGEWKEMGFHKAPLDWLAVQARTPELNDCIYVNARGDNQCGHRSIMIGLLHSYCIKENRIDQFLWLFEQAFSKLSGQWMAITEEGTKEEKEFFPTHYAHVKTDIESLKKLTQNQKMMRLQNEAFVTPLLNCIRCIIASKSKECIVKNPRTGVEDAISNQILLSCLDMVEHDSARGFSPEEGDPTHHYLIRYAMRYQDARGDRDRPEFFLTGCDVVAFNLGLDANIATASRSAWNNRAAPHRERPTDFYMLNRGHGHFNVALPV